MPDNTHEQSNQPSKPEKKTTTRKSAAPAKPHLTPENPRTTSTHPQDSTSARQTHSSPAPVVSDDVNAACFCLACGPMPPAPGSSRESPPLPTHTPVCELCAMPGLLVPLDPFDDIAVWNHGFHRQMPMQTL